MISQAQFQLFDPSRFTSRQFEPLQYISEGAKRYTQERGMDWNEPSPHLQVTPRRGYAQYLAYRDAEKAPQDPNIHKSYEAMREHVADQYRFLTTPEVEGGLGIQHEVTEHDPYPDAAAVAEDLKNRRIKTMSSRTTGGHVFFSDEENDMFRAVHDVFGHAGIGRGFSRHGEEAAYRSHRQMFPEEARAALASETRGQNSYINYSPQRTFPDQTTKLIGLPAWAETDEDVDVAAGSAKLKPKPEGVQERLF